MNVVIVTASGRGTRMHQEVPKQFMPIKNKPLVIYTLEAFQKHPNIDAILVSCLPGWEQIMEAYIKQYKISKVKWLINGSDSLQDTIYLAIQELKKHCSVDDIVMIHDGNRPLISQDIISDAIVTCSQYGSAVAVIPCVEVIVKTEDHLTSNEFFERNDLRRTQTPHVYPLGKLLWAHEEALKKGIKNTAATCDLMLRLGETIHFSVGSEKNMKITTSMDVEIFEALLALGDDETYGNPR